MSLTNRNIYLLSIASYFLLQVFFLDSVTNIWIDEPWYANTSFNFSQGRGLIDTAVGSSVDGIFNFLYPLGLGVFFKAFGTSLMTARLFSVLIGLIALLGIIQILRTVKVGNKCVFFGSLIYIFCSVNYIVYRTARPEAFEVALIIWGLYFLLLGFTKSQNKSYFWSGLITSASFLCHPNAAIHLLVLPQMQKNLVPLWGSYKPVGVALDNCKLRMFRIWRHRLSESLAISFEVLHWLTQPQIYS